MRTPFLRLRAFAGLILLVSLIPVHSSPAGSATWKLDPDSEDWNTAANWTPATVPNDFSDIATFGVSNLTNVTCSAGVALDSIVFGAGASSFSITTAPGQVITFDGAGITNNSGARQTFVVPGGDFLFFTNSATAGSLTQFTVNGTDESGDIIFDMSSSAGDGNYTAQGGIQAYTYGGEIDFRDNAIPADGTFVIDGGKVANSFGGVFQDTSNAAAEINGTYLVLGGAASAASGGSALFSTASALSINGSFTSNGGSVAGAYGGVLQFNPGAGTNGDGSFVANGGSAGAAFGGQIIWVAVNPGDAVYTANGGQETDAPGGVLDFIGITDVGGRITANTGSNGGVGGAIHFISGSADSASAANASAAQVRTFGNGSFDQSEWFSGSHILGSIEGDGQIFLGSYPLSVGSNNLNTTFSGVIQDGGILGGTGGSIKKAGSGTLTLSGANTYTGGTTVSSGSLLITSKAASGTGTGAVHVNAGTLGGTGAVGGSVTIGTGTGAGATLSPGRTTTGTLTLKKTLTFKRDGTYKFEVEINTGKADKVTAKGVTISSGALFSFLGLGSGTLTQGTVFTAIDNTATTPIAGTFVNLADGSVFNASGNNFQVSYEGGTGNDLTLTVVP
jgi:autotransporter-associated beta strand protein